MDCDVRCKLWHMGMISLVLFTSATVEFLLAFRSEDSPHVFPAGALTRPFLVYVLFRRSAWVALLLGSLISAECCCALVTLWLRFCTEFLQLCILFPVLTVSKIHG